MPLPLRHENSSVGAQCGTRCYWSTPTQSDRGTGACHLGHRNSLALGPPVGEGSGWRGRFRLGASMARAVASALAHRWRARSLPPWRIDGARGRFRLGARARAVASALARGRGRFRGEQWRTPWRAPRAFAFASTGGSPRRALQGERGFSNQ